MVSMRVFNCFDCSLGSIVLEFANHIDQRKLKYPERGECGTRFINGDVGRIEDRECRQPAIEEITFKKVRVEGDLYYIDPADYMLER